MAPYIPPPPNDKLAIGLTVGFFVVIALLCVLCFLCLRPSKSYGEHVGEQSGASRRARDTTRPWMLENGRSPANAPPHFSRSRITPSIIMPEKTLTRKRHSLRWSDKVAVSSLLKPLPPSSTLSFQHQRPLSKVSPRARLSLLNPARSRHSRSSSGFSSYVPNNSSSGSPRLSLISTMFSSRPKPVHQLFEPTLPDELAVTRYGEGLTILQSFDDGWCLVSRDMPRFSQFLGDGDGSDAGLVPAWVFDEPVEGNAVTRPPRSTSVNALNLLQNPLDSRHAVLSWSYFG